MEKKTEKNSQVRGILCLLAAMLVPLFLFLMGSSRFSTPYKYDHLELSEGWNIIYRGRFYSNTRLDSFDADGVVTGERLILERDLPDLYLFSPCLTFKTRNSRVYVYEDGKRIYSYGYDIAEGDFVPKSYHYVPLSSAYAGHFVRIEITAADDGAFSGAYDVTLGNTEDLIRHYIQSRRIGALVGVFMFGFGFLLAVLSPFLIIGAAKDWSVLFSAMIAMMLGIYVLCYNEIMAYFTHNDVLSHLIEYLTLYFTPSVIILYILTSGASRGRVKVLWGLLFTDLSLAVAAIVLHVTRMLMINHFLLIFHVAFLSESLYLIYLLVRSDRESRNERRNLIGMSSERVLLYGIFVFILSIFMEVIRYYVYAYVLSSRDSSGIDCITIGALSIVLSMMLNYFFHSVDHLTEARTRIRLHGMAYTDALTGIDNRASCDQFMAALGDSRYAVVSIDLDGLKIVNDKQGHSIGDMMISGFGALLRDAFSDCDLVGRMGGDEFLVIKKDAGRGDMEADIRSLTLGAEEENRRGATFRYAFSYGTADSGEADDVQAVYMLADERMYKMKEEHHKKRGIFTTNADPARETGGVRA
ncbi:MAG: GGDEF domain-containing protein [Lachnospiraceae bacterium]|nr:GGDEF domain-containing protein [Lachnospiraceae bacterium]